jgi:uncharacterized protein YsxB (DUF464 family)
MMNVRDLNVKEIEKYTSFVDLFITFIYLLFRNNNCDNHFTKTTFENQQFKNLKTDYPKNLQVSSFWNF